MFRSIRHGFIHFAIGSLVGAAKSLFKENNVRLYVRDDLSTKECMFRSMFAVQRYLFIKKM